MDVAELSVADELAATGWLPEEQPCVIRASAVPVRMIPTWDLIMVW